MYCSRDICDTDKAGDLYMCPQCDLRCEYWQLEDSCIYSQITYLFDNAATVAFAAFMAIWGKILTLSQRRYCLEKFFETALYVVLMKQLFKI